LESKVDQATFGLSYPSDHFPVLVFYKILRWLFLHNYFL
jgi:endonuclease/exonuclease/phosphatase (EEP) superfamily protein YafD